MRSSYSKEDVILLLKDITGLVQPQPTEERERLIQAGRHYCEMLPIEYVPSEKYMEAYRMALKDYAKPTAEAVGRLADKIIKKRGREVVLVSLARAGIPIGILVRHYIKKKYGYDVPHYSISIIRGRGIDENAMKYLLSHHLGIDEADYNDRRYGAGKCGHVLLHDDSNHHCKTDCVGSGIYSTIWTACGKRC